MIKLEILPGQPNLKVIFDTTNSLHYSAMITSKNSHTEKLMQREQMLRLTR